jgi:hypothetical protein
MNPLIHLPRILTAAAGVLLAAASLPASTQWHFDNRDNKFHPDYPTRWDDPLGSDPVFGPLRYPRDPLMRMPEITPYLAPYTLQRANGLLLPGGSPISNTFTVAKRTNVLVLGVGPSAGTGWQLGNPSLTLFKQRQDLTWETVATNSDWTRAVEQRGGPVVVENVLSRVSGPALSRTSGDAAVYVQVDPGTYRAELRAVGPGDGVLYVEMLQPSGVTVGSNGTVYVADKDTLWRIAAGTVSVVAGNANEFTELTSMASDAAGNFYVADAGRSVISKVTPQGVVTTFAGEANVSGFRDGQGVAARFNSPRGLAIDAGGTLFVADTGNRSIRRIDASGNVTTLVLTEGSDNVPPPPPAPAPAPSGGGGGGGGGALSPLTLALLALAAAARLVSRKETQS